MAVNMNEETDEGLMARVQTGDQQAFATLVRRHTNRFFGCAYRMTAHVQEAEDVVQDAFIKLWNNPKSWDGVNGAKFTTWFYRVVTNTALDALRRRKPQAGADVLDYMSDGRDNAETKLQDAEEESAVEDAIQSLPERQKAALNLCFYEGLSNKDAADIMGVSVKALESLLMRAKASLRDILTAKGLLERRHYG